MPQVIDNPDGTKTFSINSNELRALKNLVVHSVPNVGNLVRFVEAPEVRATLGFLKAVLS